MALITNDLYSESSRAPLKRIQPDNGPGAAVVREFAAGTAETLEVCTPCYIEAATGRIKKIVPGAALAATNDTQCVVWPQTITTDATSEVLGTVMLKGSVHFEEIEALRAAGKIAGTAQQLKDCMRRPEVANRGIFIEGLTKVGGTTGLS
jgi:hypothetical protein